jgi:hypothetical protein
MRDMTNDPNSEDSSIPSNVALCYVIQSLKEHEQNLDKLIGKLAEIRERIDDTTELEGRFEKIELGLNNLEREIKRLNGYLPGYKK